MMETEEKVKKVEVWEKWVGGFGFQVSFDQGQTWERIPFSSDLGDYQRGEGRFKYVGEVPKAIIPQKPVSADSPLDAVYNLALKLKQQP